MDIQTASELIIEQVNYKNRYEGGVRSHELGEFFYKVTDDEEEYQVVFDTFHKLLEEGKLKCVTEKFRQLPNGNWVGDYCWIVAGTWTDSPVNGYHHIPKVKCELFNFI